MSPLASSTQSTSLQQATGPSFLTLYHQAMDHRNREEYQEALTKLDQALKSEPKNQYVPDVYNVRGLVLQSLEKNDDALESFNEAIKLRSRNVQAFINKSGLLFRLGRNEEALDGFNQALEIQPNDVNTLHGKGFVLQKLDQNTEALKCFDAALVILPKNIETLQHRATVLKKLNRNEEALGCYNTILEIEPTNPMILFFRGALHHSLGKKNEALEDFNKAIKNKPDFAEALDARKVLISELKSKQEALEIYDALIKMNKDDFDSVFEKGIILCALDRDQEAIESFNQARLIKPDRIDVLEKRAISLAITGKNEEALKDLNQVIIAQPKNGGAFYKRGVVLHSLGRNLDALESYKDALKYQLDGSDTYNNLGLLLDELGRREEALECYNKALLINPKNFKVLHNRAALFGRLGRLQEALEGYNKAISLKSDQPLYYKNRGKLQEIMGLYEDAQKDYQQVIELEKQSNSKKDISQEKNFEQETIKKELVQFTRQEQALKRELLAAKQELKQNESNQNQILELQKLIQKIQEDQAINKTIIKLGESQETTEREFRNQPNFKQFYRTVQIKLEEIFIGCKTVSSGLVAHQQQGTLGNVAGGISLLGKLVSLVPVIGNSAGGVISAVSQGLSKVDYERQMNLLKRISKLGSILELASLSEEVARELTKRYRDQIALLRATDESSKKDDEEKKESKISAISRTITNAKEKILAENHSSQAEDVGEYGVLKIVEGMLNGQVNFERDSLKSQLIKVVMVQLKSNMKEQLSQKLGLNTITNRSNIRWTLFDFYQKPVVKTPNGFLYGSNQSDEGQYGYRYASEEEAEQWGLTRYNRGNSSATQNSNPITSTIPLLNNTQKLSKEPPPSSSTSIGVQDASKTENDRLHQEMQQMREQMLQMQENMKTIKQKNNKGCCIIV